MLFTIFISFNLLATVIAICRQFQDKSDERGNKERSLLQDTIAAQRTNQSEFTNKSQSPWTWTSCDGLVSLRYHFNFQFFNFCDSHQATLWQWTSEWNWEISFGIWQSFSVPFASRLATCKIRLSLVSMQQDSNEVAAVPLGMVQATHRRRRVLKGFAFHNPQSNSPRVHRSWCAQLHDYREYFELDVAPFYWFFFCFCFIAIFHVLSCRLRETYRFRLLHCK